MRRLTAWAIVLAPLGLMLANAPLVYAELRMAGLNLAPPPEDPEAFEPKPGAALGTVMQGYWRVQLLAPGVWAIGKPANARDNYEYLLVGKERALLIDAGATRRDLGAVIRRLTDRPLTVLPTHLHFDHTTGLRNFHRIALIDLPETRALARGDEVHLGRYQFFAPHPLSFHVSAWVRPGATLDLGEKQVRILPTPGHTASSISIYDPGDRILFTGDFLYPTTLYAFGPDTSLSAYQASAEGILATLPPDTMIYGAHCCRNDGPAQAPRLDISDLRAARNAIAAVRSGKARGQGFIMRRFPVNAQMTLLTLYPFGNR
jgi:hydroxyacylglutathione hydrolase